MRTVLALLALAACKQAPPQPAPAAGSGGSAVADARAKLVAPVELLHAYASSITVSSHVMNRSIKPEHLVDKDMSTAWNSKTGELAGAWIDVRVTTAQIQELRLTVGHTGTGPKGEDYFTMNPRITQVTILDGDTEVGTFPLDPDKRELQRIALPHPLKVVRLRVDAVVMGSKKTWKEVCVSELEAWGQPDPTAVPSHVTPIVSVFEPPLPPSAEMVQGRPVDTDAACDALVKPAQLAFDARNVHRGGDFVDEDAPPSCGLDSLTSFKRGPWVSVARWRFMVNEAHGPGTCDLVALTLSGTFVIGEERSCGPWDEEALAIDSARTEEIVGGEPDELVVTYRTRRADVPLEMLVCRFEHDRVACTAPFVLSGDGWAVTPRFAKGVLVLEPKTGVPPASSLGEKPLEF